MSVALDYGLPPDGFRLPPSTRPGSVRLQVRDLSRSLDYYTSVIGLRVVDRTDRTAALAGHDPGAVLVHLQTRPGIQPVPRRGVYGLYHFALLLPDRPSLGRFVAHLQRHRVRFGSADHLVSEALYLTDPDGLGIEVYGDRTRATWRHQSRELAMATEPLDLSSLVAAGGDGAWTGAPAGTVMGHVHLHVGDLDEARRFYHHALGLDVMVWSYPGALFLAAGGYHHHLGTNTWAPGPAASDDQARLLDWQLILPGNAAVDAAAHSLVAHGYRATADGATWTATDPWGTRLVLRRDD